MEVTQVATQMIIHQKKKARLDGLAHAAEAVSTRCIKTF